MNCYGEVNYLEIYSGVIERAGIRCEVINFLLSFEI